MLCHKMSHYLLNGDVRDDDDAKESCCQNVLEMILVMVM